MQDNAYSVAHSPDADDVFMYYALNFGWVSCPYKLESKALDIESLNVAALESTYDISAISFSLYPHIKQDYALLRTGVSFGEGYGPKMIKRKGSSLKSNFKVALSGANTTNALLFKIAYPKARIIYLNFLDIEEAVLSGQVDAGVLIHESILTFDETRLEVERFIWDIWQELTGSDLPLPLGGMALRRSIPLNKAIVLEDALTKAVKVALHFKPLLSKMLIAQNLVRVSEKDLDTYLNLYANENSCTLSELQLRAINKLYEIGYKHGFYKEQVDVNKFLIPREYETLRKS
ncbi:succinate--CoA ligase [Helicobacter sp. 13S00401-1]|uniref:menaquinone biosynthesis family protein n=1 Tax=Helicobacter sp. 13S00401-1 TaxID=1905758 RepID=UPI000BA54DC0|nr:MqnA/MqnD/SBP family protein [Helicobacter sp. 13S00401-1]PAF51072.1 succinate--CoA ligase [Helicobacter sp. 13S00401-1]